MTVPGPSLSVIAIVLTAAFLHALWNAMIKGSRDQVLTMGLINFGHGLIGLILVISFAPPAADSWPFMIASTLIHLFYYGFLLVAYRYGDLSEVYPIARGVAPVLVAVGGYLFADEWLSFETWAGVFLVSSGIAILFFSRPKTTGTIAIAAALVTGLTIAAYSLVDGMGVRLAGSAIGYIGWLFVLEAIATFIFMGYRLRALRHMRLGFAITGIMGGVVSAFAYGLAIYAYSLTSFASVSAIRESSVIMAALIGVIWFGERPWKMRMVSALVVAFGVILIANAG